MVGGSQQKKNLLILNVSFECAVFIVTEANEVDMKCLLCPTSSEQKRLAKISWNTGSKDHTE